MTYGLVLSAEAVRFKATGHDEGRRRVRKAARWLMDNSDLDRDGRPGWGLPQAWDAFQDGTTNPPNHPYTITTAIVLNGLLESLAIPFFWTPAEQKEMKTLIGQVALRWCREMWSEGYEGGFFWYSPDSSDAKFCVNAPSMFLGSLVRFLAEQGDLLDPDERRLIQERCDALARAIVSTVIIRRDAPYWHAQAVAQPGSALRPDDLAHHVYTLWGIESYRDRGGRVALPWTRAQAIESVGRFWRDNRIYNFPQDVTYTDKQAAFNDRPAVLWSVGMMLAFYSRWGDERQAARCFDAIKRDYGPWPRVRLNPPNAGADDAFYPRHAAHLLWGLALHAF